MKVTKAEQIALAIYMCALAGGADAGVAAPVSAAPSSLRTAGRYPSGIPVVRVCPNLFQVASAVMLGALKSMTALHHANGGRPFTPAELAKRTPLEDAMTL